MNSAEPPPGGATHFALSGELARLLRELVPAGETEAFALVLASAADLDDDQLERFFNLLTDLVESPGTRFGARELRTLLEQSRTDPR